MRGSDIEHVHLYQNSITMHVNISEQTMRILAGLEAVKASVSIPKNFTNYSYIVLKELKGILIFISVLFT
jgi:hypothetical protein